MTSSLNDTISFNAFWKALNDAMKDRGQPELKFGEARIYWELAQEQKRVDRNIDFRLKMEELGATFTPA